VSEGEILYLPAGWFHHVAQECGNWSSPPTSWASGSNGEAGIGQYNNDGSGDVAPCIAVNYWFDGDYEGERYVMRELQGRLVAIARHGTP